MSIKARQLESLPKANRFIIVMHKLTEWQVDLDEIMQALETAKKERDGTILETIAKRRGLDSPKGLVQKLWYEDSPPWLQIIWMASAQHYYYAKTIIPLLWDFMEPGPNYDTAGEVIYRCERSIHYISELRSYLKYILPTAYLEAPEFRSSRNFFDEPD